MTETKPQSPRCGDCHFWWRITSHVGACRLQAPRPGESRDEVTHWAQTSYEDFCGEWHAQDRDGASMTLCKSCAYWFFREGGLTPVDRRDATGKMVETRRPLSTPRSAAIGTPWPQRLLAGDSRG